MALLLPIGTGLILGQAQDLFQQGQDTGKLVALLIGSLGLRAVFLSRASPGLRDGSLILTGLAMLAFAVFTVWQSANLTQFESRQSPIELASPEGPQPSGSSSAPVSTAPGTPSAPEQPTPDLASTAATPAPEAEVSVPSGSLSRYRNHLSISRRIFTRQLSDLDSQFQALGIARTFDPQQLRQQNVRDDIRSEISRFSQLLQERTRIYDALHTDRLRIVEQSELDSATRARLHAAIKRLQAESGEALTALDRGQLLCMDHVRNILNLVDAHPRGHRIADGQLLLETRRAREDHQSLLDAVRDCGAEERTLRARLIDSGERIESLMNDPQQVPDQP